MIDRLFRRVSNIQILLNMASSIAMIVDSIVIGKFLGLEAIAAYGAVTPLLMIVMAMSQVLSTGGQIRCSAEIGKSNLNGANGILSLTALIGLIFSLIAVLVTILFQIPICSILGVSEDAELLQFTRQYMVGFMIGAPAFVGMLVLVPFVQLDGDKKCVLLSVIVMTVGDIIGDLAAALVFNMGMFGIGLASSISYYIALAILILHFAGKKAILHPSLRQICFKESGPIVGGGLPAALQKVLRSLLSLTLNYVLMAIGGSTALGIFSVVNSVINFCNSVGQGMGAGTLLLTGIYAAEGDKAGLKNIVKAFLKQSAIYNAILFVAVFLAASPLISLFTESGDVDVTQTAMALRFGAVDFVLFSIANCFKNFYQGLRDSKLTYLLTVSEAFLFSALAAWPLGKLFGVNGVCMVYAVGDLMTLVLLAVIISVKRHTVSFKLENLILLRSNFGIPDSDYYKTSLNSDSEIERLLSEMDAFLDAHNKDGTLLQTKTKVRIAAEELCRNIFDHGFEKKSKNHLDVSLLYRKGEWILRLRDDCKGFDPVAYHQNMNAPNGEPDIQHGLDRVFAQTDQIQYLGTLGLNNLNLHFSDPKETMQ